MRRRTPTEPSTNNLRFWLACSPCLQTEGTHKSHSWRMFALFCSRLGSLVLCLLHLCCAFSSKVLSPSAKLAFTVCSHAGAQRFKRGATPSYTFRNMEKRTDSATFPPLWHRSPGSSSCRPPTLTVAARKGGTPEAARSHRPPRPDKTF